MAQTWDLLRGDPTGRGDRDFYQEMITRYGQPVLDAGCGTGRLLLDYLGEGIDIDGVDVSPEMLELCREKANKLGVSLHLFEQPLERLMLPRRYRTILASSSVLQLITDPATAQQAVTRLYDHLQSGGILIAPFMTLWQEGMPLQQEWENATLRQEDGAMLTRMGRVWYDPESECEHTEDLYQVLIGGEVIAVEHHRRSPASRSYTPDQARILFERAGFRDIRLFEGLPWQASKAREQHFTVAAVKQTTVDELGGSEFVAEVDGALSRS